MTPMALIDLLAILPLYLSVFFAIDTRILRVLRLLRVFKLTRHFAVLEVLGTV
jgi:voltage-gated potassium channel